MADGWIRILDDDPPVSGPSVGGPPVVAPPLREGDRPTVLSGTPPDDPSVLILTCANCGAAMDERKCKLICACGYFLSCSDYY